MPAHPAHPATALLPTLHVLLIEDQPDIAANLWDFLERRGYQVCHGADGASGQRALLRAGWGEEGGDLPALQTQVYELRTLVDKPFAQQVIRAVRGIGYRLVEPA